MLTVQPIEAMRYHGTDRGQQRVARDALAVYGWVVRWVREHDLRPYGVKLALRQIARGLGWKTVSAVKGVPGATVERPDFYRAKLAVRRLVALGLLAVDRPGARHEWNDILINSGEGKRRVARVFNGGRGAIYDLPKLKRYPFDPLPLSIRCRIPPSMPVMSQEGKTRLIELSGRVSGVSRN